MTAAVEQRIYLVLDDTPPSTSAIFPAALNLRAESAPWRERIAELFDHEPLPAGLERVDVEAEISFPDRRRRNPDNFGPVLRRALRDLLPPGTLGAFTVSIVHGERQTALELTFRGES
jgi:hypothetical protein